MNKIFTAYIPTYNPNHGDLKALVDLLLKFKDRIEILILDDVSTPEFRKHLLDNYSDKATIVLNEKNQNKALNNKDAIEKHIKTKYFHPIDPDDLVKQENFEKFLDMLDKSSADLIFNNWYYKKLHLKTKKPLKSDKRLAFFNANVTYSTEVVKGYDPGPIRGHYEDIDLPLYALRNAKNIFVNHKLKGWYLYTDVTSSKPKVLVKRQAEYVKLLDYLFSLPLPKDEYARSVYMTKLVLTGTWRTNLEVMHGISMRQSHKNVIKMFNSNPEFAKYYKTYPYFNFYRLSMWAGYNPFFKISAWILKIW